MTKPTRARKSKRTRTEENMCMAFYREVTFVFKQENTTQRLFQFA